MPERLNELISNEGRLFVVSGPSGVGKDAVLGSLFESAACPPNLIRCVTATTRAMRPGEQEGVDYFYMSEPQFALKVLADDFLEHAQYGGNYYGTPAEFVRKQRSFGQDVLLKIEVQGARQVKAKAPDAVLIFLGPPSLEELRRRLFARDGTSEEHEKRLRIALDELDAAREYDYLIVNKEITESADAIRAIIIAERRRIKPPKTEQCANG